MTNCYASKEFRISASSGEHDYSIRAWLDPQKLSSRNITAIDVADAVRKQNLAAALGQIGQPPTSADQGFQIPSIRWADLARRNNSARSSSRPPPPRPSRPCRPCRAARPAGFKTQMPPAPSTSIVRSRTLPSVEMGALNYNQVSTFDGNPAVGVAVFQLPGHQCPRCRQCRPRQNERAVYAFSRRHRLQDRLRHHALHQRIDWRSLQHPGRRDPAGGAGRLVLSCRTGGP